MERSAVVLMQDYKYLAPRHWYKNFRPACAGATMLSLCEAPQRWQRTARSQRGNALVYKNYQHSHARHHE